LSVALFLLSGENVRALLKKDTFHIIVACMVYNGVRLAGELLIVVIHMYSCFLTKNVHSVL